MPAERHTKTQAAHTTTKLETTARPGPTPAQIQAQQQRDPEHIDKQGRIVKAAPSLPVPLQLTDAQRAENLRRNMAAIGTRQMSYIYFEGKKNVFEIAGEELPTGQIYVCLIRQTTCGFRRFNGKGGHVDLMMRRLDEPQYTRDDLDKGYEEEDTEFGRRPRWHDYIVLPLIDANNGGGELFGFETRNVTSWWAAKNLIGRCQEHSMFLRGMSPIVTLEIVTYKHTKYGLLHKPRLKGCRWANPDGSTIAEPDKPDLNDKLPDFA
jgi:hypothetical protein